MTLWSQTLLIAAALAAPPGEEDAAARRLAFMQDRLGEYTVSSDDDANPFDFRKEPLLRWSNPVSGKVDGGVFLWERDGRPMLIEKVYLSRPHVAWGEAIQSLAPGPVTLKSKRGQKLLAPSEPGLRFVTLTEAPAPHARPAGRLVQMRGIARRFDMSGEWGEVPQPWELRLMPEPMHRYEAPGDGIIDGVMFGFVQEGTNPEGLVVLEAIETSEGTAWRFAVTRLTKYHVEARYSGKTVEVLPRLEDFPPSLTFRHDFHWLSRWPFGDAE